MISFIVCRFILRPIYLKSSKLDWFVNSLYNYRYKPWYRRNVIVTYVCLTIFDWIAR